jgi:hypothetical protein
MKIKANFNINYDKKFYWIDKYIQSCGTFLRNLRRFLRKQISTKFTQKFASIMVRRDLKDWVPKSSNNLEISLSVVRSPEKI